MAHLLVSHTLSCEIILATGEQYIIAHAQRNVWSSLGFGCTSVEKTNFIVCLNLKRSVRRDALTRSSQSLWNLCIPADITETQIAFLSSHFAFQRFSIFLSISDSFLANRPLCFHRLTANRVRARLKWRVRACVSVVHSYWMIFISATRLYTEWALALQAARRPLAPSPLPMSIWFWKSIDRIWSSSATPYLYFTPSLKKKRKNSRFVFTPTNTLNVSSSRTIAPKLYALR